NLNILKVKGRSDLFLKVEILKKIFGFLMIFVAIPFGIMAMVISAVIVAYISTFINMLFSGRLIDYNVPEQLKDILRIFISGIICFFISYYFRSVLYETVPPFTLLMVVSGIYCVLYVSITYLLDREPLLLLKKIVKNKL